MHPTKYFYKTTQVKSKLITLNRFSFKLIPRTFLSEFSIFQNSKTSNYYNYQVGSFLQSFEHKLGREKPHPGIPLNKLDFTCQTVYGHMCVSA